MTSGPEKARTVEEQLAEVYALVDELHHVEDRLRRAVSLAVTTLKRETVKND